jgi:hypothetical protein
MNPYHSETMIPHAHSLVIAWYRIHDGNPAIHFPPALWEMVCTAVQRHGDASPHDVITNYVNHLARMNIRTTDTIGSGEIAFEWLDYGESDGEEPQAVLVFRDETLATIARLWNTSEEEARKVIADSLLLSIAEQYEMSGTA